MLLRRAAMRRARGPGLLRAAATTAVVAGTATAVSGAVRHRQDAREAEAYEQQQAAAYAQPVYAEPPRSTGITDEQINRLERLAELHKAGVLSDQEFAAQKAEILGQ